MPVPAETIKRGVKPEAMAVMSAVRLGYENEAKTKPTSILRLLTGYITGLTKLTK